MMNDAMRATVNMLTVAIKARGRKPGKFQMRGTDWGHLHVTGSPSGHDIGHVTVYASGRWSAVESKGVPLMHVPPALEALRFRRSA